MTEWKKKLPMNKEKALSMLGLARRAGRLSMGHDMAEKSVASGKAQLILFASDVSDRLYSEFEHLILKKNINVKVKKPDITMNEIHFACGYKAGVITVDDVNFASKIISLLEE